MRTPNRTASSNREAAWRSGPDGVTLEFETLTTSDAEPIELLELLKAWTLIVWLPLPTVPEFQLTFSGGLELK